MADMASYTYHDYSWREDENALMKHHHLSNAPCMSHCRTSSRPSYIATGGAGGGCPCCQHQTSPAAPRGGRGPLPAGPPRSLSRRDLADLASPRHCPPDERDG